MSGGVHGGVSSGDEAAQVEIVLGTSVQVVATEQRASGGAMTRVARILGRLQSVRVDSIQHEAQHSKATSHSVQSSTNAVGLNTPWHRRGTSVTPSSAHQCVGGVDRYARDGMGGMRYELDERK